MGRAKIKRESLTQISESQQALAIYFTMGKTTDSMAARGAWEHGRAWARRWAQGQTGTKGDVPASSERGESSWAVGVSGSE